MQCTGVAEVLALEPRDIGGNKTAVYILEVLDSGVKRGAPATGRVSQVPIAGGCALDRGYGAGRSRSSRVVGNACLQSGGL
jgi:hypothetical protein